jgi:hypothetical protein
MIRGVRFLQLSLTMNSKRWAVCNMGDRTRNPIGTGFGDSGRPHAGKQIVANSSSMIRRAESLHADSLEQLSNSI